MKTKKFNSITLIKDQNIFDITLKRTNNYTVLVPHVCNNINVFGGGFTKYIDEVYPVVGENFRLLGNKAKLGHTQFIDVYHNKLSNNKIIFCNMIAQNGTINNKNPRPLNYFALANCMWNIKLFINDLSNQAIDCEIHCPKFGSGLAGGNWIFISELIKDIWSNIPVSVYQK